MSCEIGAAARKQRPADGGEGRDGVLLAQAPLFHAVRRADLHDGFERLPQSLGGRGIRILSK